MRKHQLSLIYKSMWLIISAGKEAQTQAQLSTHTARTNGSLYTHNGQENKSISHSFIKINIKGRIKRTIRTAHPQIRMNAGQKGQVRNYSDSPRSRVCARAAQNNGYEHSVCAERQKNRKYKTKNTVHYLFSRWMNRCESTQIQWV